MTIHTLYYKIRYENTISKEVCILLLACPECGLQVSDKAYSCPHCGYPLKQDAIQQPKRKSTRKRRKLPNGFGQITEIKTQNLSKPFRASVIVGKTPEGKPVSKLLKPIAYFKTYNEAYEALIEYHKDPYDISKDITVSELYERWRKVKLVMVTEQYEKQIGYRWEYCTSLHTKKVRDVRTSDIAKCIETGIRTKMVNGELKIFYPSDITKGKIKIFLGMLWDYAIELDIVDINYAKKNELPKEVSKNATVNIKHHFPFTEDELDVLWQKYQGLDFIGWILIQCYMGWRPQELTSITLDNVNLEDRYIKGGMKTDAGKNRIVPIHSKILPLVNNITDTLRNWVVNIFSLQKQTKVQS